MVRLQVLLMQMMVKKTSKSSTNTDIFSKNGQIQFEANQPGPQSPKPLSQKKEKRDKLFLFTFLILLIR